MTQYSVSALTLGYHCISAMPVTGMVRLIGESWHKADMLVIAADDHDTDDDLLLVLYACTYNIYIHYKFIYNTRLYLDCDCYLIMSSNSMR